MLQEIQVRGGGGVRIFSGIIQALYEYVCMDSDMSRIECS